MLYCHVGESPFPNNGAELCCNVMAVMTSRTLVSFDWAMRRLLRSQPNFVVLEGFLTSLLGYAVTIEAVLESESLKDYPKHKQTRVDLRCRDHEGRLLLIEVQHERQDDFLSRLLFGASKALVDALPEGSRYREMSKVIVVSLVYFQLGVGQDYVYHGTTRFHGLHNPSDELQLSDEQRELYQTHAVHQLFPEYYILRVNEFDSVAKDNLDEWLYMLKHSKVRPEFKAPGLKEAAEKLAVMKLSEDERRAYDAFRMELHDRASSFDSSYGRGRRKGLKQGRDEGLKKGLEQGLKQGREEGMIDGQRRFLLKQLQLKFGAIDAETQACINAGSADDLDHWAERMLNVDTVAEVFVP